MIRAGSIILILVPKKKLVLRLSLILQPNSHFISYVNYTTLIIVNTNASNMETSFLHVLGPKIVSLFIV